MCAQARSACQRTLNLSASKLLLPYGITYIAGEDEHLPLDCRSFPHDLKIRQIPLPPPPICLLLLILLLLLLLLLRDECFEDMRIGFLRTIGGVFCRGEEVLCDGEEGWQGFFGMQHLGD